MIPGSAADGIPLLIGAEGDTQALERLPLTPEGRGVYDEAWLQRLIHQNPSCLPIAEIEPALDSFSSVCCEIPTQRGFIDNLLMTGRGDIAIVEAKLFRNPEVRRQALAQALDYSTCLFSMGYAEFEKAALLVFTLRAPSRHRCTKACRSQTSSLKQRLWMRCHTTFGEVGF